MIIAAVLNAKEQILPIVEGDILRLYDTELKQFKDYENPALQVEEGKRGLTLQFAAGKGATAFAAPPQMFCEISYQKARTDKIQFYPIDELTTFGRFLQLLDIDQIQLNDQLAVQNIAPSKVLK